MELYNSEIWRLANFKKCKTKFYSLIFHFSLSAFLLLFSSCQPTLIAEFQDKPVVESYFYADNEPVVRISKLIPFRNDVEFSDEDINLLAVTVTDNTAGESRILSAQGDGIYTTDGFRGVEGHTYTLSIPYNGEIVTATTTIPPKPAGMKTSKTSIEAGGFGMGGGTGGAEITWDNPGKDYYMLKIENLESNPSPIFEIGDDDEKSPGFAFRTEPTQEGSSTLSPMSFSYYGRHNVILIRMQPEYVLLYSSNGSTSSTLTEIHANIEGGYGIFTGVNSDTLRVTVTRSL